MYKDDSERWPSYSGTKFAAIASTIEALWDGRLDAFVGEMLFGPLSMHSTLICDGL